MRRRKDLIPTCGSTTSNTVRPRSQVRSRCNMSAISTSTFSATAVFCRTRRHSQTHLRLTNEPVGLTSDKTEEQCPFSTSSPSWWWSAPLPSFAFSYALQPSGSRDGCTQKHHETIRYSGPSLIFLTNEDACLSNRLVEAKRAQGVASRGKGGRNVYALGPWRRSGLLARRSVSFAAPAAGRVTIVIVTVKHPRYMGAPPGRT